MTDSLQVIEALKKGAIVITPNNRLANELLERFFKNYPEQAQSKPLCLPFEVFLHQTFRHYQHQNPSKASPILLTSQQLRHLWEKLITKQSEFHSSAIEEIQEAWNRCHRWQIPFSHPSFKTTPQTRHFQQLAKALKAALQSLSAITQEELIDFFITNEVTIKPQTIIWYCFDDFTPLQRRWHAQLSDQGCVIVTADNLASCNNLAVYAAPAEEEEYQQLLNWVSTCAAAPHKKIGIIIPDLATKAPFIQRLFQQQFPHLPINMSLGHSLSHFPLVAHALCWLQLKPILTHHQARLLLSSPYLAFAKTEMLGRNLCLEKSTLLQEMTLPLDTLAEELIHYAPKLRLLLTQLAEYPDKACLEDWIGQFIDRLNALGFPGDYPLNSLTYQTWQRFLSLFEELKTLSFLTPTMSQEEALKALLSLAKTTVFQPEKTQTNIHILGLLEASGCHFDRLWILGMTDEVFPQKARLSPFIPIALQREKKMPYADQQREFLLAEKLFNRITGQCTQAVLSYAHIIQDKPNLPSPFLADLPAYTPIDTPSSSYSERDYYEDHYQHPLIAEEAVAGGSALLGNQAKCPFRAFAAHRLHTRKERNPADGLTPMVRGQILHKTLEILWTNLQSQAALLMMSPEKLHEKITSALYQALKPYQPHCPSFSTLVHSVEFRRLSQLIEVSLEWEKQRPPFEIEALEQAFIFEIGGLSFNLRLDRLDKVNDDSKWVIDYKSSIPTSTPWKEERPQEPQLLLYALLDPAINTVLFMGLKGGQLTCKGLSAESLDLKGLKIEDNWTSQRTEWTRQLTALAEEYRHGYCPPAPVNAAVCQQCDYQALCRFHLVNEQKR